MKFKAGTYYVGDVCYVIKDEDWMPLLEKSKFFNCQGSGQWEGEYNECPMFVASTAYGDGTYHDEEGRGYAVDAGVIGIMSVDAITTNPFGEGGQVITFDEDFEVSWEAGDFQFGHIHIDTRDEEEDEEEMCEYCGFSIWECCCDELDDEMEEEEDI